MTNDPNISTVELVADALGPLREDLVLVGGCAVGLLITDRARPPVRQTVDVDLVVEVTSVLDYYGVTKKLKGRGFYESPDAENFCRWRKGSLIVDLMPSNEAILGHSANPWYPHAVHTARPITLPNGTEILVAAAPIFLATKLESYYGRGNGDYTHHDMEDIINLVDGRSELIGEVEETMEAARLYIRREMDDLLADPNFVDGLPQLLRPDGANQARLPLVLERLRKLAGL